MMISSAPVLSTGDLLLFVVLQALYSGVLAAVLSVALYGVAERGLNSLLEQIPGECASHLLLEHYGVMLLAVLGASGLAAALGGWRVTRIEASQGLRHV
jgi:putative ABC transport system permease protein